MCTFRRMSPYFKKAWSIIFFSYTSDSIALCCRACFLEDNLHRARFVTLTTRLKEIETSRWWLSMQPSPWPLGGRVHLLEPPPTFCTHWTRAALVPLVEPHALFLLFLAFFCFALLLPWSYYPRSICEALQPIMWIKKWIHAYPALSRCCSSVSATTACYRWRT